MTGDLAFAGLIGSSKVLLCVSAQFDEQEQMCTQECNSKLLIFLLHLEMSKTHQLKKKKADDSGIPHTGQLVGSEPIPRLPTILDLS